MRKAFSGVLTAMLLVGTVTGAVIAADPFVNGSFEDGIDWGGTFIPVKGPGIITGWTAGGENGVAWKGSYLEAAHGTRSIDLNRLTPGSMSQTFDTKAGTSYRVDFKFSGNPVVNNWDCPASGYDPDDPLYSLVKTMSVHATGGRAREYRFDTSPYSWPDSGGTVNNVPMTWVNKVYRFTATGASTTLTFQSTSTSKCGPTIDYVRVGTAADCKKGGWDSMVDASGTPFASQGECVSFYKK
jgi:choice-of-anchor C domain-containing protein